MSDKRRQVIIFAVLAGMAAFHASVNALVLRAAPETYTWVTMGTDMDEQIVRAELDLPRVAAARRQIPALANRRPDALPPVREVVVIGG